MKKKIIAGAAVSLLAGAAALEIAAPPTPRLIYNKSDSAPIGWYRIDPGGRIEKAALVAAFPPDDARKFADSRGYLPAHVPLIKTVWATAGDEICAENGVASVAGKRDLIAQKTDSAGREMPSLEGCFTLAEDEVFLVSTLTNVSFDSRYFGPVRTKNILGTAHYLNREPE